MTRSEIKPFREFLKQGTTSKYTMYSRISDVKIFFTTHKKVDREEVQKFVVDQLSDGMDPKTVKRRVGSIRKYAEFIGVEIGKIETPQGKRRLDKIKLMSEHELLKLRFNIDEISPDDGYAKMLIKTIIILLGLGLRRSEIRDLRVSDIDLSAEEIRFTGKGDKGAIISLYSRSKDIDEFITLREQMEPVDDYLLSYSYWSKYKQIGFKEIYKILYNFTEEVLGKKVNPHSFRHSIATVLLNNNTDLRTVQEVLRHEDIQSTQIYTHIPTDKIKSEVMKNHPMFK